MKFSNILFLLLIAFFLTAYSCSTEEEIEIPEVHMMDDDDDDDGEKELVDAPTFSLQTTNGDAIESSDFEDKNLVIFFFGYNCPPCKAVGPDIETKLFQKFVSKEDFAMIGVDQWDGNDAGVNSFQNTTGITFPLGVKGAQTASSFETTYDRLVVVNSEGKIVYKGTSIARNNLDEVIEIVSGLVK